MKEKTRRDYLSVFRLYQEFTELRPRQMIDEAEEELKLPRRQRGQVREKLMNFYNHLVKEYLPKRGRNAREGKPGISRYRTKKIVEGALASFYKKNGFPQNVKVAEASPKKENFRVELSPSDIKWLLEEAGSKRNRALVLLGFQGGFDAKTATLLDVADLPDALVDTVKASKVDQGKVLEAVPTPWMLHVVREKEGMNFHTCIGRDGAEAVIGYLWERLRAGENIALDSPLFVREEDQGEAYSCLHEGSPGEGWHYLQGKDGDGRHQPGGLPCPEVQLLQDSGSQGDAQELHRLHAGAQAGVQRCLLQAQH